MCDEPSYWDPRFYLYSDSPYFLIENKSHLSKIYGSVREQVDASSWDVWRKMNFSKSSNQGNLLKNVTDTENTKYRWQYLIMMASALDFKRLWNFTSM